MLKDVNSGIAFRLVLAGDSLANAGRGATKAFACKFSSVNSAAVESRRIIMCLRRKREEEDGNEAASRYRNTCRGKNNHNIIFIQNLYTHRGKSPLSFRIARTTMAMKLVI
jgi:hypothetical protein